MIVAATFEQARAAVDGIVGLVPTMGYLHEGHLALLDGAASQCDAVVASIFVNPLQFGPGEDLARYPRNLERDLELCEAHGVDVVFAPAVEEVYPEPAKVAIVLDELTEHFEGAHRPGHFEGVALVVTKLLAGLQPDRAYFGRKDAQQLAVVRRLVLDLSLPVEIVPIPTIRQADGLALSSRNRFLTGDHRRQAQALSTALFAAADAVEAGERDAEKLESIVRHRAAEAGPVQLEYAALADAATARPLPVLTTDAFLAVAARVGETRLIDNIAFSVDGDGVTVDRGVTLDGPSVVEDS